MVNEQVEEVLNGIRPMLKMQGKDASIVSADESKIKIALTGFCGTCGCSDDYVESLGEMLQEKFPHTQVEIEMA